MKMHMYSERRSGCEPDQLQHDLPGKIIGSVTVKPFCRPLGGTCRNEGVNEEFHSVNQLLQHDLPGKNDRNADCSGGLESVN